MSNYIHDRDKRRLIILKGISQDLKYSEIATQLGVNRWFLLNELRLMRKKRDPELKWAEKEKEKIRANKQSITEVINERFLKTTGMTLQEKSFRNMIHFYKPELRKILKSKDQYIEINKLPKSIRKTLIKNEIVTKGWNNNKITANALKYLINP